MCTYLFGSRRFYYIMRHERLGVALSAYNYLQRLKGKTINQSRLEVYCWKVRKLSPSCQLVSLCLIRILLFWLFNTARTFITFGSQQYPITVTIYIQSLLFHIHTIITATPITTIPNWTAALLFVYLVQPTSTCAAIYQFLIYDTIDYSRSSKSP